MLNIVIGGIKRINTSRRILLAFFLTVIVFYFPFLIRAAQSADSQYHGTVPTTGDDGSYQVLAVNMLHGYGFSDGLMLPIETYHLDLTTPAGISIQQNYNANGPSKGPSYSFYRAPGFPLLLAATYAVAGNTTMAARLMLAVMAWMAAIILLLLGDFLDGWRGTLAAGLVGLIFLNFYILSPPGGPRFLNILTEIPTTFYVVCFGLAFSVYLKSRKMFHLAIAAILYLLIVFTRTNFLVSVPLMLLYVMIVTRRFLPPLIMATIITLPILAWSLYASNTLGQFVGFTTQSAVAFPDYNNMDVIEGVGPDRLFQGEWNPGWEIDTDGNLTNNQHNSAKPGENPWAKGFAFWRDNPGLLPQLFYLKLRTGFWYSVRTGLAEQARVRLYSLGLGFVFLAVGLRSRRNGFHIVPQLRSKYVLAVQLGLIFVLLLIGNSLSYLFVLIALSLILVIAISHPYGDIYQLRFPPPNWLLCFIAGHLVVTLLFGGIRYHQPLDPLVLLFGVLGSIIVFDELVLKRRLGVSWKGFGENLP